MKSKIKYNTRALYFTEKISEKIERVTDYPLTVIQAPMGYGKTTTMKQLLNKEDIYIYWLNIYTNSVEVFWRGFSNLISKIDEKTGNDLSEMGFPDDDILKWEAIQMISNLKIDKDVVIVIDDYQFVSQSKIDEFLEILIKDLEENIHIVIGTRNSFLNDINELQLKHYLNYISKEDMEFTREDIVSYYQLCKVYLKDEYIDKIYKYSEGWISVIYLFMLNYTENKTIDLQNNIYDLMETTVYRDLRDELKDLLLRLSIFDKFSMDVIRYIAGEEKAEILLSELLSKNGFIKYDSINKEYYFHSILKKCLDEKFEEKPQSFKLEVYKNTSKWFYNRKEYLQAMEYFYKSGDFEMIMECIEKDRGNTITMEQKDSIINYMESCPKEIKKKNHLAMLIYTRRLFTFNEKELFAKACRETLANIQADGDLTSKMRNQLLGEIQLIISFTKYNDIEEMSKCHRKACELMSTPSTINTNHGMWTFGSLSVLYMFYREKGKLDRQLEIMKESMPYYYKVTSGHGRGAEHMMEAEVFFNRGDFENAEIAMHKAILDANMESGIKLCGYFLNIRILLAKGLYEKAISLCEKVRENMDKKQLNIFAHILDLFDAFIYSNLNNKEKIPTWIRKGNLDNIKVFFPAMPCVNLVYSKVLLVQEEYTKLLGFYEKSIAMAKIFPNLLCEIYANIHVSACFNKLRKKEEAFKKLKCALDIAMADDLYMPFVENYNYIEDLFRELKTEFKYRDFIRVVEKLYKEYKVSISICSDEEKVELTNREMEVAILASKGMTNKEIADKIYVSVNTVKATLKTVFKKLSIKSRAQLGVVLDDILN
ncbi:MAG: LuxR C-terminal-related transcriptional regulator [Intestinibacter sp.]